MLDYLAWRTHQAYDVAAVGFHDSCDFIDEARTAQVVQSGIGNHHQYGCALWLNEFAAEVVAL